MWTAGLGTANTSALLTASARLPMLRILCAAIRSLRGFTATTLVVRCGPTMRTTSHVSVPHVEFASIHAVQSLFPFVFPTCTGFHP